MALYDNWTYADNTITIVADDVRGYDEEHPFTFQDIIDCDAAKGWGADVAVQCANQFCLGVKLVIGDGSTTTWFKDKQKQVIVKDIDAVSYENIIEIKKYGYFVMGTLTDATEKSSKDGVQFISLLDHYTPSWHQPAQFIIGTDYTNSFIRLYSCSFIAADLVMLWLRAGMTSANKSHLYNSYIEGMGVSMADNFNNVYVNSMTYTFQYARGIYEKLTVYDTSTLIYTHYDYAFELKNVYGRGNTYIARPSGWTGEGNLIDCDFDNWSFNWAGTCTGKVWRQYKINIKVTDKDNNPISGATVTLRDKNGDTVFSVTTDVNGEIATQTVSRGWYEQATGDTLNDLSPHTLTIEKAGYQTYQKKFVLDEKTTWEIKLARAIGVFLDFGRPVVNLKKSDPENKNVLVL